MTQVEEAINLVDNLCGSIQLNRDDHVKVNMAINMIRQACIYDKEEPPDMPI